MRMVRLVALVSLSATTVFAQQLGSNFSESTSAPGALQTLITPAPAGGAWNNAGGHSASAPLQHTAPFSGLALGIDVGVLGIGVEAATPLSKNFNLSGGASFFSYSDDLTSDGVQYDANLRFRSVDASLDWFPLAGGFHISPGALLYDGNQINASALVPGRQIFTLNHVQYMSSAANPVSGSGSLTFNKAAPGLTLGFGNMIPRSGRHFSAPIDLGFAYVGEPKVALNLSGTVCDTDGSNCQTIASSPTVQANVTAQQAKIQNDVSPARVFPVFHIGLAYSF
ncbi:MAG TPA: hypothetical protein VME68_00785 [Acidobacteriaceae bacterium]|nr:hypothetical protein [Acidobacteriaceae bacterium]